VCDVEFVYVTGIRSNIFRKRSAGRELEPGRIPNSDMDDPADGGVPLRRWLPSIPLCAEFSSSEFTWGVMLDAPGRPDSWGITQEIEESGRHELSFTLGPGSGRQVYHLTHCRRLGANKYETADANPAIRFAVWAPNAQLVEVVQGNLASGYIADDGSGTVGAPHPMFRDGEGIWRTDPAKSPETADFSRWDHVPYMFRVTKDDGSVAFRTDLHARCQLGRGATDPAQPVGQPFSGNRQDLDGTISCSVVIDPERVTELFDEGVFPETRWLSDEDFWAHEHDPLRPVPTRVEDLIIYELHIGGLGAGRIDAAGQPVPGNLRDAIDLLDHLTDLGINAIELMPLAEHEGWASWGYGTSHYFAVEFSGGGRDQFKHRPTTRPRIVSVRHRPARRSPEPNHV